MNSTSPGISQDYIFDEGSFRDRTSRVIIKGNCIYRLLDASATENWNHLKSQSFFSQLTDQGRIVETHEVTDSQLLQNNTRGRWTTLLQHRTIPFISYPYEWSFNMLKDAALLQLEILAQAIEANMILKDATSFNIQWQGPSPVFIDIGSFVKLQDGQTWIGYRQFCELFLFPLMLQSYKGLEFQTWLRGNLDGISASDISRLFSFFDLLKPGVLLHAKLQAKLQSGFHNTQQDTQKALKQAGFNKELIKHNIRSLVRLVKKLQCKHSKSTWSHYTTEHNYSNSDLDRKTALVRSFLDNRHKTVWDFGCNTGTFSRIAAEKAEYVIALDFDALAIDHLYLSLKQENNSRILPLVFNLANPSPELGWRNRERKSLLSRGRPDLILSLALIHHLVISANIPLDEVIAFFASMGGDLVIEFVDRNDSMVKRLLLNKEDNYLDYNIDNFEKLLGDHYQSFEKHTLESGNRSLYYAKSPRQTPE